MGFIGRGVDAGRQGRMFGYRAACELGRLGFWMPAVQGGVFTVTLLLTASQHETDVISLALRGKIQPLGLAPMFLSLEAGRSEP